jgi:hypothetical protein
MEVGTAYNLDLIPQRLIGLIPLVVMAYEKTMPVYWEVISAPGTSQGPIRTRIRACRKRTSITGIASAHRTPE